MAINYFTINGYTVSLPLNDTQWYDLVVEKDAYNVKLHKHLMILLICVQQEALKVLNMIIY